MKCLGLTSGYTDVLTLSLLTDVPFLSHLNSIYPSHSLSISLLFLAFLSLAPSILISPSWDNSCFSERVWSVVLPDTPPPQIYHSLSEPFEAVLGIYVALISCNPFWESVACFTEIHMVPIWAAFSIVLMLFPNWTWLINSIAIHTASAPSGLLPWQQAFACALKGVHF